jgi:NADPH-dependent glutamate synthase beta subunit-like oxidoreductase
MPERQGKKRIGCDCKLDQHQNHMTDVRLHIDDQEVAVPAGITILEAAKRAGIYIPGLCCHPDLPPAKGAQAVAAVFQGDKKVENAMPGEQGKGCGLCLVEVVGDPDLVGSCGTEVKDGMVVQTENERIRAKRRENLIPILERHPHACLTCAQQEGCSRSQCSSNVPENERCCPQFGHCELQDVVNYVALSPATPKWIPTHMPVLEADPLFIRDPNLCIGCTRCVRVCRDLKGIEALGFVYDETGEVQIGTLKPTLMESGCRFCTACVEACPTGALRDKSVRPGKREEDIVPCRAACPVHMDVPGYLRLIAQGKTDQANGVIREKVPFPGVLGRICPHPCEEVCRRADINGAVSICALKRYAADRDKGLWKRAGKIKPDSGKRVAIVGSGPAGLTAAFYLKKQGHGVTVFERRNQPGGMMRYGIPAHRLPRKVLEQEIQCIMNLGVELRLNQAVGTGVTLDQLRDDGYDAVFLGVGAQLSRPIDLEGSDLPDVLWGLDFLSQIGGGRKVSLKERVVVVGGGDAAVDAALTALRCGAKNVTMVCLESRADMPARDREIDHALSEGVNLMPSWGPNEILINKGRIMGMELVGCRRVYDGKGNFGPAFDDTKKRIEADQIILATGQSSDLSFIQGTPEVRVHKGLIVVDPGTLETGMKGVFAGGDVISVSGTVIHAIAAGRQAAAAMDRALGGDGDIEEVLLELEVPSQYVGRDEGFDSRSREKAPELDLSQRQRGFAEVVVGFSEDQAIAEAGRCLQCDLRLTMGRNPSPPDRVVPFDEKHVNQVPEAEGVFRLYDPDRNVLAIRGTANLRESLLRALQDSPHTAGFDFQEDKMYSQRESEWIQQHVQEHGEMPGGGDGELDDLF